ncbi:histidinol-phosphate transaminase [Massilia yuzhufengensis]|uniref:Histidinol-phosphate aminotransferase n=1 Tax=Massilia yuzhufengensis TaxID=1164594 RepID=A0A1I1L962_9BURK|nr:histidinol-phosphate transaminase [Massilia yuzhufengensis]SFC69536.1 histidinol phosphate aminotransferase apoenzyme [Massilia yuzhufengensis]
MSSIDKLVENTIREDIRAIASYHVPDARGYIKLDAMENPYALPEHLRADLGQRLADAALNRYPVPSYATLKAKICASLGVPAGYDVLLGNGSDELISIMATAVAQQGRRAVIMAPTPAFIMFSRSAQFAGADFVGVPVKADFSLDLDAMLAAIAQHQPALVFLAYPNNPTGNLFDAGAMEAIIGALGETGIAVVDEAYQPFARQSFMGRLPEFPNLVVMRTLSKLGLAGIRLGYLSGDAKLLEQFEKVRPPYNVNVLTQVAAEFALEHLDVLDQQAGLLNAERSRLAAELAALPGVEVFPSAANFISMRVPDGERTVAELRSKKVLIKNLSKMDKMLVNCIRVTVSTPEENTAFLNALKASL